MPLCPLPTLTDALVHVGVAGIEVSRRAGRQADAHLADVVPLEQDEQLRRALEAAVDLGAELTAFGAGLIPLGTDCKCGTGATMWLEERRLFPRLPQGWEVSRWEFPSTEGTCFSESPGQAGSSLQGCFINKPPQCPLKGTDA